MAQRGQSHSSSWPRKSGGSQAEEDREEVLWLLCKKSLVHFHSQGELEEMWLTVPSEPQMQGSLPLLTPCLPTEANTVLPQVSPS